MLENICVVTYLIHFLFIVGAVHSRW